MPPLPTPAASWFFDALTPGPRGRRGHALWGRLRPPQARLGKRAAVAPSRRLPWARVVPSFPSRALHPSPPRPPRASRPPPAARSGPRARTPPRVPGVLRLPSPRLPRTPCPVPQPAPRFPSLPLAPAWRGAWARGCRGRGAVVEGEGEVGGGAPTGRVLDVCRAGVSRLGVRRAAETTVVGRRGRGGKVAPLPGRRGGPRHGQAAPSEALRPHACAGRCGVPLAG